LYHTVVRLESPAIMSKTRLMPGIFNRVPNRGTLRRKFIATGRKPLEQSMMYAESSLTGYMDLFNLADRSLETQR